MNTQSDLLVNTTKDFIRTALSARGYQWQPDKFKLITPNGTTLPMPWIDIVAEHVGDGGRYSYRRTLNGKVRIYVGDHGKKTVYRQRKDGTFRTADLVNDIILRAEADAAQRILAANAEIKRKENETVQERLCAEYKISKWGSTLRIGSDGTLTFTAARLNAEQAEALLAAAKLAGINLR